MSSHPTISNASPTHATGSAVRSGPVLVGVGGHDASAVRVGALVANRLGRDLEMLSVSDPEVLAHAAHERDAPLLVMGIGRRRPFDRLIGGETVRRTIEHADCPVLAVAQWADSTPASAAVGVDFSRSSAYAAQSVVPLLDPGATLHLVHVWQPSDVDDDAAARDNDTYRRHLTERFRRFIESLALPASVEVKTEVREGRAAERLVDFAEAHRVDVIAIGRNGRRMVERLLVGGVGERVLRNAECSVLIAPDCPLPSISMPDTPSAAGEQTLARSEWETTLEALSRRNAGRVVTLEVNDPEHGVASRELGYILFGITYAARDRLVSIALGETSGRRQHRTWQVFDPRRISITRDGLGELLELRIQHGDGTTLLSVGAHPS